MIGLDTNVLVRLLTADQPEQTARAQALLQRVQNTNDLIYVNNVVLVETVWVLLQRRFHVPKEVVLKALEFLLNHGRVRLESPESVAAACQLYAQHHADFADCLVAAMNVAAGCAYTVSFDQGMKTLPHVSLL